MLHERSYLSVFILAKHTLASQIFAFGQHVFPIGTIVTGAAPKAPRPGDGHGASGEQQHEDDDAPEVDHEPVPAARPNGRGTTVIRRQKAAEKPDPGTDRATLSVPTRCGIIAILRPLGPVGNA
jgi:hypothetical protein